VRRRARRRAAWLAASLVALGAAGPAVAVAADEIDRQTAAARAELARRDAGTAPDEARVAALEAAIARGEAASKDLRGQIDAYQKQVAELRESRNLLASGLVGAVVTAIVAIMGALTNARRSQAERDLKRLEVLEKASQLRAQGLPLPPDIVRLLDGGAAVKGPARGRG
jgi:chromosome segregation ATPase